MNCGAGVRVCALLLWMIPFATGCATVVKGRSQTIAVNTDPEGAKCALHRNDEPIGVVHPTPGTVQISKSSAPISIHCNKQQYLDANAKLVPSFQGWTLGNAVLGGIVGIVVDAGSGAMNEYESAIVVKLTPESFSSAALRDAFLDDRRKELESNKKLKQEDKKMLLAEIDETKKRVRIADSAEEALDVSDTPVVEVTGSAAHELLPSHEHASLGRTFRAGDQWKYRLSDGRRTVSTIVITISETNGNKVKERITREGAKGFVVEREVEAIFNPSRFLDPVTLPGGYQLSELAPYFPHGTTLKTGQTWDDIPGDFQILIIGKRTLISRVKVEGKEQIRVPAGSFLAWRIVADVEEASGPQGYRNKLKYQFWYAPDSLRVLKIASSSETGIQAHASSELYELVESGRGAESAR